jgi:hypothetical protein
MGSVVERTKTRTGITGAADTVNPMPDRRLQTPVA